MIILARESRAWNQAFLAKRMEMTNQQVNKIETGVKRLTEDLVKKIAHVTHYPVSFFEQQYEAYPEHLTYRARVKTIPTPYLKLISAKSNVFRFHLEKLTEALGIKRPDLAEFKVDEKNTPQVIAQKVRKAWGIDTSVPPDMVELMESRNIPITSTEFFTDKVECRMILTDNRHPLIIYNKKLRGDRLRFCLAYHLGNIVMHSDADVSWTRDVNHEATQFAAEFLMPEKEIRKDFKEPINVTRLGELKLKWKMPMISILHRAHDLGFVTDMQKKYLIDVMRQLKIKNREPRELDVKLVKPTLLKKWLAELKKKNEWDDNKLASFLCLKNYEYINYYGD
jgi:Zn-dependent peptidase ImmA (M78 family)/transcriptional regulator with XRE-family HTH domain